MRDPAAVATSLAGELIHAILTGQPAPGVPGRPCAGGARGRGGASPGDTPQPVRHLYGGAQWNGVCPRPDRQSYGANGESPIVSR